LKILGIIGGIAPASTIEYYRLLVEGWRQRMPGYPPVLIDSIDLDRVIGMVSSQHLMRCPRTCRGDQRSRAPARSSPLASNTPHVVFDRSRTLADSLISIEATCSAVRKLGSAARPHRHALPCKAVLSKCSPGTAFRS
jgi:aspartate racemase